MWHTLTRPAHFVWEYDAERRIAVHAHTQTYQHVLACGHTFRCGRCWYACERESRYRNEKNIPIRTSINICVAGYAVRMLDRGLSQTHLTHTANVHFNSPIWVCAKFPLEQRSNWLNVPRDTSRRWHTLFAAIECKSGRIRCKLDAF